MVDIVVTEFMHEPALGELDGEFTVGVDTGLYADREALVRAAAGARALIVRNQTRVDAWLLGRCPSVTVIGRLGVGLDNIDLDACATAEVEVFPATDTNAASVAEYVISAVLMLLRGAFLSSSRVLAGEWPRRELVGREAAGKTLGLIGFGGTARETARRARGLDMSVVASDPPIAADDPLWAQTETTPRALDELLQEADVVSVHVPLLPSTRHLIDARAIERMKPGAYVINAARGGIVDERALVAALRSGRLGGAMLDVFETEPLSAGSILVGAPNLIVTPHIAGVTEEANERISVTTVRNVARALRRRTS